MIFIISLYSLPMYSQIKKLKCTILLSSSFFDKFGLMLFKYVILYTISFQSVMLLLFFLNEDAITNCC